MIALLDTLSISIYSNTDKEVMSLLPKVDWKPVFRPKSPVILLITRLETVHGAKW